MIGRGKAPCTAARLEEQERRPDPLDERPPEDQFCDLVLNGGVASGVVYPWALLELARHYRFKNIGGNSVGAMAAALAAAAEYGRCNGYEDAFEVLRHLPLRLARPKDEQDPRTKLLRLFQPSPTVRRLFELFLLAARTSEGMSDAAGQSAADAAPAAKGDPAHCCPASPLSMAGLIRGVLTLYGFWWPLLLSLGLVLLCAGIAAALLPGGLPSVFTWVVLVVAAVLGAVTVAVLVFAWRLRRDLKALAANDYGICKGLGQAGEEGLVEWLHKGIQLSAGRNEEDPPLSFADLWSAPRCGRAGPSPLRGGLQPPDAGIDLQMFASNVTQGRPIRLPVNDANTRLFFDPDEWEAYFPPTVMKALKHVAAPYRPASVADPDADEIRRFDPDEADRMGRLRELPSGGMPIVVAARMSLCFPVLFSCVPVWAIDYESAQHDRRLRRCLLSDGGLCTNFPIHLFDAAHPRWPTFALLLDRRLEKYQNQPLWLPRMHRDGRGDNWQRIVPGAEKDPKETVRRGLASRLLGFAGGLILTMKDWNDRVTGRLPQVRNRIVRLALRPGEGQLSLAMPGCRILRMADEYGTCAGRKLVSRFAPDDKGAKPAWREHLYVRSMVELRALRQHLKGYAGAVRAGGGTLPLRAVLDRAVQEPPLASWPDRPDVTADPITAQQRQALERAVQAIETLEAELAACEDRFGPYEPVLEPEFRLRPPV